MKKINWKYALGEILIVIIGITIAFSLNKCSVQNENQKLSELYLTHLKRELEQDKSILEANVEKFEHKRKKITEITALLDANTPLNAMHSMLVFEVSELEQFKPNNVTYNTLINSGDFKLIKNFGLRKGLEEHYNNVYSTITSEYMRLENIHKEYLADYYIYHMNYDNFKHNEFAFEDKKLLYNILKSTEGASQFAIAVSQTGAENCKQLIRLIDEHIQ